MKALLTAALLVASTAQAQKAPLRYDVNLADTAHHQFAVTLKLDSMQRKNPVFEFAATAPGTYQVMDVGRFVHDFTALDKNGKALPVERISVNQYQIERANDVREIRYRITATRDTVVDVNKIYPMCGTLLREKYSVINGQAVFGFPRGMQGAAIDVKLSGYPSDWIAGTALTAKNGVYRADSFDHLVDSPIQLGRQTVATVQVSGAPVEIYVQSASEQLRADQLRDAMRTMLLAAGKFIGKLPVDRYTFLFDFAPDAAGAWEHSYSSSYVLTDQPYTEQYGRQVTNIAAHEFFHIVTPLNIHSEIIERFNFAKPTPSQHLWLYEGTTEWAAHKMQLEAGMKTPEQYLNTVVQKSRIDHTAFDTTYSLTKLALTSYSDEGQQQYGNIYMRGAIVAGLLDLVLLDGSNGAYSLKQLLHDLSKDYGKRRAFPEDSLFAIVERKAGKPAGDFLRHYVQNSEHPPVKELYAKLGIRLIEDEKGLPVRFEIDPNPTAQQLRLRRAWLGEGRPTT